MISRRNIRVKVMQTLYSLETMDPQGSEQANGKPGRLSPDRLLQQHLEQTTQLFTYLLYCTAQVALYSETNARLRASRHLPSKEDLNVNTKIAGNEALWRLLEDPSFQQKMEQDKLKNLVDPELIKKLFLLLAATEAYQQYISIPGREEGQERDILLYIFNELIMKNELFDQHMEDLFLHWSDDREMSVLLAQHYFQKPQLFNFLQLISPEKTDYAKELLSTVQDKKEYCLELIRPKLQNWDPDRIAAIDMLLMEMGLCEFLYFPTIPTKVTINEYIDLAKVYSTPQSGQFVNGILDNILKDLETQQKVHKTERARK